MWPKRLFEGIHINKSADAFFPSILLSITGWTFRQFTSRFPSWPQRNKGYFIFTGKKVHSERTRDGYFMTTKWVLGEKWKSGPSVVKYAYPLRLLRDKGSYKNGALLEPLVRYQPAVCLTKASVLVRAVEQKNQWICSILSRGCTTAARHKSVSQWWYSGPDEQRNWPHKRIKLNCIWSGRDLHLLYWSYWKWIFNVRSEGIEYTHFF